MFDATNCDERVTIQSSWESAAPYRVLQSAAIYGWKDIFPPPPKSPDTYLEFPTGFHFWIIFGPSLVTPGTTLVKVMTESLQLVTPGYVTRDRRSYFAVCPRDLVPEVGIEPTRGVNPTGF